ncbi:hypothetical protein MAMC_01002 [Methylacidimicrobium cyclopophantes]|uniref:Uncharacterized protein n=1 Tax=Methylacidimicrobium cyclopophantes TaxID=1041766 RepID=A0A5E6MD75_9BACT|nr:hypothetical protein [Methylacidimicrobium cyclopophantes]VVM06231.1 hypothetical protein MAMC_01002 [Methylacidimicrobium cyclopophantes]
MADEDARWPAHWRSWIRGVGEGRIDGFVLRSEPADWPERWPDGTSVISFPAGGGRSLLFREGAWLAYGISSADEFRQRCQRRSIPAKTAAGILSLSVCRKTTPRSFSGYLYLPGCPEPLVLRLENQRELEAVEALAKEIDPHAVLQKGIQFVDIFRDLPSLWRALPASSRGPARLGALLAATSFLCATLGFFWTRATLLAIAAESLALFVFWRLHRRRKS